MALAVLLLTTGALVLLAGGRASVSGALGTAAGRRLSPVTTGILLLGVDLGAVTVVLVSTGRGQTALAGGQAVGTILFVFAAGFGSLLLVSGRPVEAPPLAAVIMPAGTLVAGALALSDQVVTRGEGVLLLAAYALYVSLAGRDGRMALLAKRRAEGAAAVHRGTAPAARLVAGLALAIAGAVMLSVGATRVLDRTTLSAGFVGAVLLGTLAGLDAALLGTLPARRGGSDLAAVILFGTIAAFSTGVLGLAAIVRPLVVDSAGTSGFVVATLLYAVLAGVLLARGRAWRVSGLVLVAAYAAWLVFASRV